MVFLHIAKTAGTSLESSLAELFQPVARCPLHTDDELRAASSLVSYDYFHGHFTMRCIRDLMPDADIITMLRAPLTRAVSQYQSWHDAVPDPVWDEHLEKNAGAFAALAFAQRVDVHEFFNSENPAILRSFTNYQTYILSDCDIAATEFRVWDEEVLASAKQNLVNRIRVFGIAERMEDSLMLIRNKFDRPTLELRPATLNRSRLKSADLLDSAVARRIESRSPMDLELYDFAVSELERRILDTGLHW